MFQDYMHVMVLLTYQTNDEKDSQRAINSEQ